MIFTPIGWVVWVIVIMLVALIGGRALRQKDGLSWILLGVVILATMFFTTMAMGSGWGGWTGWNGPMMHQRGSYEVPSVTIPGAVEYQIVAGDSFFDPDQIEVLAGTDVTLTVENVGRVFHDLTIPSLGLRIPVNAGATSAESLAAVEPGRYTFECTVPGHAAAGMVGVLVVTP